MKIQMICETLSTMFGGSWMVEETNKTNFSIIHFLSNGKKRIVAKDVVPHLFEMALPEDREQLALQLNTQTHCFREVLKRYGVPITEDFITITPTDYSGAIHLLSHEGANCSEFLLKDFTPENARLIIRGILNAITGVLHQGNPPKVGTDLQLSNFAKNGSMTYIDVFPPLYYSEEQQGYIVHIPQPTDPKEIALHVQRKFMTPGTLRRFRFFTLSLSKGLEDIFLEEVKNVLDPGLWAEVDTFFNSLPDNRFKTKVSRTELVRTIEEIPADDVDTFRDIAIRVVPDNVERAGILHQVFRYARNHGPGDEIFNSKEKLIALLSPFAE